MARRKSARRKPARRSSKRKSARRKPTKRKSAKRKSARRSSKRKSAFLNKNTIALGLGLGTGAAALVARKVMKENIRKKQNIKEQKIIATERIGKLNERLDAVAGNINRNPIVYNKFARPEPSAKEILDVIPRYKEELSAALSIINQTNPSKENINYVNDTSGRIEDFLADVSRVILTPSKRSKNTKSNLDSLSNVGLIQAQGGAIKESALKLLKNIETNKELKLVLEPHLIQEIKEDITIMLETNSNFMKEFSTGVVFRRKGYIDFIIEFQRYIADIEGIIPKKTFLEAFFTNK